LGSSALAAKRRGECCPTRPMMRTFAPSRPDLVRARDGAAREQDRSCRASAPRQAYLSKRRVRTSVLHAVRC